MRATIGDVVVAEATDQDVIEIEGNAYFPPASIAPERLRASNTEYTCPWKGAARYFDVSTPDGAFSDAAWSYPEPYDGAAQRVGRDFAGYVAFDRSQVAVGR